VKRLLGLVLATALLLTAGVAVAAAASLNTQTKKLGAGSVAVGACGALTGVTVTYNVRDGNLIGLTVRNIPSSCSGARLSAAAADARSTDIGHGGPVVVAGGTAVVKQLSASPVATAVASVRVVLVGP
jgi:hypothetical protein